MQYFDETPCPFGSAAIGEKAWRRRTSHWTRAQIGRLIADGVPTDSEAEQRVAALLAEFSFWNTAPEDVRRDLLSWIQRS